MRRGTGGRTRVNVASARRRPFVAGNWKMNKTVAEARAFVRELRAIALPDGVEVALAPPFISSTDEVRAMIESLRRTLRAIAAD